MLKQLCLGIAMVTSTTTAMAGQNIVVVLDDSGSMKERLRSDRKTEKIDAAKQALNMVLQDLSEDAQIGIVALNDGWILPLGPVDKQNLSAAIARIRTSRGTPLGRFMKVGADALLKLRDQQRYGSYKLLIVTDGEANDRRLVDEYLPDILSRGIAVDVIGVDMQGDHSLATKVTTYRRADDARSLQQAISEIVLGESTADDGQAGESDFELLADIPDEVAAAALSALTDPENQPIGETPEEAASSGGQAARSQPITSDAPAAPAARNAPRPGSGFSLLSYVCGMACLGIMVFLLIVGTIAFRR